MASHFEKEMDATFQISVVSVFLAPESGPVGIFKDFKIQFLVRLVAENMHFLHLLRKKDWNKNSSGEKKGNILCAFFKAKICNENKNKTSGPRIPQGIFCWSKAKILLHRE